MNILHRLVLLLLVLAACTPIAADEEATVVPVPTATPALPAAADMPAAVTASPTATTTAQPGAPEETEAVLFEGARAMAHAEAQCAIGPRPTGSEALLATRAYIEETVRAEGWTVVRQDGEFMGVPIHNVIAVKGEGVPRMAGAHYDTRPVADMDPDNPEEPIIGGNDGASGVAVLLELARVVEIPEGRQVQLAFFDAEDRGNLEGWPFSVGAEMVAAEMPVDRPEAMVVLDMIGDADLQIFRERNSDIALTDRLFEIAAELGFAEDGFYNREKWTIIDDHLPFIQRGIPAAVLIDFDYPYWHTVEDTCDKLGVDSLYKVGRVMQVWLEE
jgi:glutaminyl-peptide cyclotransferase